MSDAVEQAIIALVLQGSEQVSQQTDRVNVDLSSAERAGRRAEEAAKSASASFEAFAPKAELAIHKLHLAVRLVERMAKHAGVSSEAQAELSAVGEGVAAGAVTFRLLSPFGLPVQLTGAALAGGYAAGAEYREKEHELDKRREEDAQKIAKHLADELERKRESDLALIMLQQAGQAKLDAYRAASGRTVP